MAVLGKESKVDHWAAGTMRFKNGVIAHFDCGMMVSTDWAAQVFGTKGKIKILSPWVADPGKAVMELTRYSDGKTERIEIPCKHIFAHEAETVARNIGNKEAPEMTLPDTLGNMRALDLFRASLGLRWPQELRAKPRRKGPSRRPKRR